MNAETQSEPKHPDAGVGEAPGTGATVSQAGERRSARIEALRGLPALIVIAEHVFIISLAFRASGGTGLPPLNTLLEFGRVCVFFFFALSGYLIFWPFARSHFKRREPINLRQYAANRALRVLPLYLVVVVVLLVLRNHDAGAPVAGWSASTWLRFLTFTQDYSVGSAHVVSFINPPMWTMLLEVQFYIVLPLVAYLLARISRGSIGVAAVILGVAAVIGLYLRFHLLRFDDTPGLLAGVSLPTTFYFFIPGMLLALARIAWERRPPGWARGVLTSADAWLVASIPFWVIAPLPLFNGAHPGPQFHEHFDFLVRFAAFLVLGAVVLPLRPGPLSNLLEWRPLVAVGVASYSIYMWHYPIISALYRSSWFPHHFWTLAVIAAPLAIGVGLLSYRFIEAPFLGLRKQWANSSARQDPSVGQPTPEIATAEAGGS